MRLPLVAVAALCCSSAAAEVLLNEVLYDPSGADGGHEFVELVNVGAEVAGLGGIVLEFANGAVGDIWAARWRAAASDSLGPGARWLIVDRGWSGAEADAEVSLGLQNGPDALRIRRDEQVLDLVGWGALEHDALSEGRPHPGAPSGSSLARRPDGADSDRNDLDWHAADEPTPGAANVRARSLRWLSGRLEPPAAASAGAVVSLRFVLANDGTDEHPGGDALLSDDAGERLGATPIAPLASGDETAVEVIWRSPGAGRRDLILSVAAADGVDTLVFDAGGQWTGQPDLALTEVMPVPESGAPEWVEVIVPEGRGPLDLDGWTLEDDGGTPRALPPLLVPDGERLVLAADVDAFQVWHAGLADEGAAWACPRPDPDRNLAELVGGWPVLNNTAGADDAWADRLVLRGPDGVAVDWVAWGGPGVAPVSGRSLERLPSSWPQEMSGAWAPAVAGVGSTPGCLDSVAERGAAGTPLGAAPRRFGDGGTTFSFELRSDEIAWTLDVLDLDGRRVRSLGGDALGAGRRVVPWNGTGDDGSALPPGPLLACLRVRDHAGGLRRRETVVVVRSRS